MEPVVHVEIKYTVGSGNYFTAITVTALLFALQLDKMNRLTGKVSAFFCFENSGTFALIAELASEND